MNELILVVVMGVYSLCNQRHDALNEGKNKWPNSGWRLVLIAPPKRRWWKQRLKIVDPDFHLWGTQEEVENYTVLKTIDRCHLWKWAMFYICPVYIEAMCIWPSLIPNPWAMIPATALATVIWKALPQPEHWNATN